jgi:hypothetical protein
MGFDGFHQNGSSPELEFGSNFDFSSAFDNNNISDPTNSNDPQIFHVIFFD